MYMCPICKKTYQSTVESKKCYQACIVSPPVRPTITARELGAAGNEDIITKKFKVKFFSDDNWGLHKADSGIHAVLTPSADVLSKAEALQLCCDEFYPERSFAAITLASSVGERTNDQEGGNDIIHKVEKSFKQNFKKVSVGIDPELTFEVEREFNRYDFSTFTNVIVNGRSTDHLKIEILTGYILKEE